MPDFLNGTVQDYLDQLASGEPTPGGGSAAGLSGAMGAALLCMSARFTIGREKYAAFQEAATAVLEEAEQLRTELQGLTEADAVAYGQYRAAVALPKATEEEKAVRHQALQAATTASAQVPLRICRVCFRLLELAGVLAGNCNPYLVSDVVVATHLALAGFRSAIINVRMNLGVLEDLPLVDEYSRDLARMVVATPILAQGALETAYRVMHLPIEGDLPA